jgi:hypothetical protein
MPLDLKHCYEILESREGASLVEVRASYRQLMKVWHPDRFAQDTGLRRVCEEKAKRFSEAYKTIEALLRMDRAINGTNAPAPRPPAGPLDPAFFEGKYGYTDSLGYLRIPAIYDSAGPFSEGLAAVSRDDNFGYIDEAGCVAVEMRFTSADTFAEGRALVEYVRFAYINRNGDYVVPPRFQAGSRFQEGSAAVKLDGKWGYIRTSGEWFILPRFDEAQPFQNGRAYARMNGRPVVVQANGQIQGL